MATIWPAGLTELLDLCCPTGKHEACVAIKHLIVQNEKGSKHIKKQRHYFANKGLSSQGYGFSSSHVWM